MSRWAARQDAKHFWEIIEREARSTFLFVRHSHNAVSIPETNHSGGSVSSSLVSSLLSVSENFQFLSQLLKNEKRKNGLSRGLPECEIGKLLLSRLLLRFLRFFSLGGAVWGLVIEFRRSLWRSLQLCEFIFTKLHHFVKFPSRRWIGKLRGPVTHSRIFRSPILFLGWMTEWRDR